MSATTWRGIWALTVIAVVLGTLPLWSAAPATLAAHFSATAPDGFMGRDQFLMMELVMLAVLNVSMAPFASRALLRGIGASAINIPHKDYWLRSENVAEMYERLIKAMSIVAVSMNAACGLVVFAVFGFNLGWFGMSGILAAIAIAIVGPLATLPVFWVLFRPQAATESRRQW